MITLVYRNDRSENETYISFEGPSLEFYSWIQKIRQPPDYTVPIFQRFINDDYIDEYPIYFK